MTPAPFSCQGEPPQGVLLHRTPILRVFKRCHNKDRK
nr:MAG TPA: Mitochondrial export protein Som1 [Caudoviricetes sp.]DAM93009.1 MAG TPA: Mitochondrial export protein Som1 [Caudoviricetes sp.]